MTEKKEVTYRRFALSQRIEHELLMVSFSMLCLTGLPQKFATNRWAHWIIAALGGIDTTRFLHHFFALMLLLEGVYHVVVVGYALLFVRPRRLTMLPGIGDVMEGLRSVAYLAGFGRERPRAGRYDFKQKVEYWAMIWGTVIMGLTGLILLFPVPATRYIPGLLVPVAKTIHGYEAILAFLAIITWHFYSAHLASGAFPLDASIFTGRISRERMLEEHPLEYEQWEKGKSTGEVSPEQGDAA
jgi:formate dehydrogenase subunit gamma